VTDAPTSPRPPDWTSGAQWTAVIAELGAPTPDGRWLDPAGQWTLGRPAPLIYRTSHIGTVDLMVAHTVDGRGVLRAFGTVYDPAIAQRMAAGELYPQMELGAQQGVDHLGGGPPPTYDLEAELVRFRAGTIRAVVAGERPAWPGHTFTVGSGWPEVASMLADQSAAQVADITAQHARELVVLEVGVAVAMLKRAAAEFTADTAADPANLLILTEGVGVAADTLTTVAAALHAAVRRTSGVPLRRPRSPMPRWTATEALGEAANYLGEATAALERARRAVAQLNTSTEESA
jgi:hypothetical protein